MIINISDHYFAYYANMSEKKECNGFRVGEIITDWEGITGCILLIFDNGEVRTDSNGMGEIRNLKKLRSRKNIENYLKDLHRADLEFITTAHEREINKCNR